MAMELGGSTISAFGKRLFRGYFFLKVKQLLIMEEQEREKQTLITEVGEKLRKI